MPLLRRHAARALFIALAFAGCSFELDRTDGLADGEIRFTPRRADGSVADEALVAVSGSQRVTAAGADGVVLSGLVPGRWLVRVTEDDRGDGTADRGAWISTALEVAPVPKSLSDGCTGTPAPVVTSVLLEDVPLAATVSLDVTVTVDDGNGPRALAATEDARIVVWRTLDGLATAIEHSVSAPDGDATVEGIIAGDVHVAAFVFDTADGLHAPRRYATVDVTAGGTVAIVADKPARDDNDEPKKVPVQIETQWSTPDTSEAGISQVSFTVPHGGLDVIPADPIGARLGEGAQAFVVDAPIGVVDLTLTADTAPLVDGVLLGAVVVPEVTDPLGPVELPLLADPCNVDGANRDCDHDGTPAGEDTDDDADGQPDAEEPEACRAPGLGPDSDGDGACEPAADALD